MKRILILLGAWSVLLPGLSVQAQESMIVYGLGRDSTQSEFHTSAPPVPGPGGCGFRGPETRTKGVVYIAEDLTQALPRMVRIPQMGEVVGGATAGRSGNFVDFQSSAAFPGGLFINTTNAQFNSHEGSVGQRVDAGGGQTAIDWDFAGCETSGPGGADQCGLVWAQDPTGLGCCASTTGTICSLLPQVEYTPGGPFYGPPQSQFNVRADGPRWLFTADPAVDASATWLSEPFLVPGIVHGQCSDFINGCDREAGTGLGDNLDTFCPGETDFTNCDFADDGYRIIDLHLQAPGGRPNPATCNQTEMTYDGIPNVGCALYFRTLVDGDPLAGCFLTNFGIVPLPDIDCNGLDDTVEGRCQDETTLCSVDTDCTGIGGGSCINGGDLCPSTNEENNFADSNADGIGDECQCGDGNADGAVTGLDIAAVALCANGAVLCDFTLVDADGDGATTGLDIGGVVSVVNGGTTTADLVCTRNP